jgi:hypothetical protein
MRSLTAIECKLAYAERNGMQWWGSHRRRTREILVGTSFDRFGLGSQTGRIPQSNLLAEVGVMALHCRCENTLSEEFYPLPA